MTSSFTFWQQLVLNMAGPALTVLVGSLAVGELIARLQRRRDARAEAERLAASEQRRAAVLSAEERIEARALAEQMFSVAYRFYVPLVHATREQPHAEAEQVNDGLAAEFQHFQIAGRTIEARLRVRDQTPEQISTRWIWHCVLDLLTVFYFHNAHGNRVAALLRGQQAEHTRTVKQGELPPRALLEKYLESKGLEDPDTVKARFADALDELIALCRVGPTSG